MAGGDADHRPITTEITEARNPTSSDTRDPQMVRASTERPLSSVPVNSALGGENGAPVALDTSSSLGHEQRREHGHGDEQDQDGQPDHADAVAPVLVPGPATPPAAAAPEASPAG